MNLKSRNSATAGSVGFKEHALKAGDEANSIALPFFSSRPAGESDAGMAWKRRKIIGLPTILLHAANSPHLSPAEARCCVQPDARLARDLEALLKVGRAVNSVRSVEALARQIVDFIFEVSPADNAAILLSEHGSEQCAAVFGWSRHARLDQDVPVSRAIVDRVLNETVALLVNAVRETGELSPLEPGAGSVLAVPLAVYEKTIGVIYLHASGPGAPFDESLLQLMLATGSIAAMAFDACRRLEWLQDEKLRFHAGSNLDHNMVGDSLAMREVHEFIDKVGPQDSTVLICGESGTGKELVARAMHRSSSRANKPYVAINCAALTETLLESELFGHERGAFTGAVGQKKGKLETAEGGTLFLDEIGEIAPMLQAKLLRVLQEREFERVGGTRSIKLDIRVIAASNRDLREEGRQGKFRSDLYFRLNVVSITMPTLRDRREDIPMLASHFASRFGEKMKRAVHGLSPQARACLMNYDWPGNVRELENAMERAVVLGSTELIVPENLPQSVLQGVAAHFDGANPLCDGVRDAKRQLVIKALDQTGGNQTEAAKLLSIHPNHLSRLIRNMRLKTRRQNR